jgi:hypothetical protein
MIVSIVCAKPELPGSYTTSGKFSLPETLKGSDTVEFFGLGELNDEHFKQSCAKPAYISDFIAIKVSVIQSCLQRK